MGSPIVAVIYGNLNRLVHMLRTLRTSTVAAVPVSGTCPGRHSELGPVQPVWTLFILTLGELPMFEFRDLFQWDRFITPDSSETAKRASFVGSLEGRSVTQFREH